MNETIPTQLHSDNSLAARQDHTEESVTGQVSAEATSTYSTPPHSSDTESQSARSTPDNRDIASLRSSKLLRIPLPPAFLTIINQPAQAPIPITRRADPHSKLKSLEQGADQEACKAGSEEFSEPHSISYNRFLFRLCFCILRRFSLICPAALQAIRTRPTALRGPEICTMSSSGTPAAFAASLLSYRSPLRLSILSLLLGPLSPEPLRCPEKRKGEPLGPPPHYSFAAAPRECCP